MTDTLLLIGEFSKISGVSKRMLRHYDKLALLKPLVDEENGYRFYSKEQLEVVKKINHLQDFGFSLKTIVDFFESPPDFEAFMSTLKDQEAILRNEKDIMTRHLLKLGHFIDYVEKNPDRIHDFSTNEFELKINQPQRSISMNKQEIKDTLHKLQAPMLFTEQVNEGVEQSKDQVKYFLTLDIDRFMQVNDNYGYDVGDAVIYAVYNAFYKNFLPLIDANPLNQFSRLGGDEFAIFLIGCTDEEIEEKATATLNEIAAFDFPSIGCDTQVTSSIGIVKATQVSHQSELRHHSTKALLDAKRNGRSQYKLLDLTQ